jgi:hypothetical protein
MQFMTRGRDDAVSAAGPHRVLVSVIGPGTWQFGGEWGNDFTPG